MIDGLLILSFTVDRKSYKIPFAPYILCVKKSHEFRENMTKIGIDARLTYYRDGGISTYIRRLVQALEQLDTSNQYTIFHSRKDDKSLSDKGAEEECQNKSHHD